jgi:glycosyltransferase involved in cell wall biosynthesis
LNEIDNPTVIGLTVTPNGSSLKLKKKSRFLFLEPFFGGSHREFAEGLVSNSRHRIDLLTLPARFWKWRMRGAALYFIKKIPSFENYDGLITTDLMSLSDFKALSKGDCPPALVYFHENQLTYPLAPGEQIDFQFGFTDITTAVCADRILFNSRSHCEAFFADLPGFLKMMPEYRPGWVVGDIRAKSDILYPGCRFPAGGVIDSDSSQDHPPLIVWNHRWEFDKNPDEFFKALDMVLAGGTEFRLALLGENFQMMPKAFIGARDRYGERIVQYGYVGSRQEYLNWLKRGSIVISTARQENFGIAVIEAIRHACAPLLPTRLAYPEIVPQKFHNRVLYKDFSDLVEKLTELLTDYSGFQDLRRDLSIHMGKFAWENLVDRYDEELENLAHLH